LPGF